MGRQRGGGELSRRRNGGRIRERRGGVVEGEIVFGGVVMVGVRGPNGLAKTCMKAISILTSYA